MATKKSDNSNDGTKKKSVKSKAQQKKDILDFASKAVKKSKEVTKKASKGKSKGTKRIISAFAALVLVVVIACGCLYYFDVAPFDVVYSDALEFKYYTFDSVTIPSASYDTDVDGELVIHFIDVGQGDCIFIQFPDGYTMLIDGGENRTVLKTSIPEYLLAVTEGDTVDIDCVMLTHCDSDHCGSLGAVIANDSINVKSVRQPRVTSKYENDPLKAAISAGESYENVPNITTGVYSTFVQAVYEEIQDGICSEDIIYNFEGQILTGENWSIHIYNPNEELYKELASSSPSAQDKNNISPIMVLNFAGKNILLTGDADEEAEVNFAENLSESNLFSDSFSFSGDVDVLKVAHHGGQYSTLPAFLAIVKPEYAVISVGPAPNKHGHPTQATLDRLAGANSKVYMTKDQGNIICTITAEDISWTCETPPTAYIFPNGIAVFSYYTKGLCA